MKSLLVSSRTTGPWVLRRLCLHLSPSNPPFSKEQLPCPSPSSRSTHRRSRCSSSTPLLPVLRRWRHRSRWPRPPWLLRRWLRRVRTLLLRSRWLLRRLRRRLRLLLSLRRLRQPRRLLLPRVGSVVALPLLPRRRHLRRLLLLRLRRPSSTPRRHRKVLRSSTRPLRRSSPKVLSRTLLLRRWLHLRRLRRLRWPPRPKQLRLLRQRWAWISPRSSSGWTPSAGSSMV